MRRFWAIARLTALESVRSRFVVVIALALAVAIVALAVGVEGDGTLTGQIQAFLDYSVTLTQVLIGLLTVLLAAFVTTGDIHSKTIFTTATKPVRSVVYVTGRWFGVVLVAAALLAASMGSIHGLAHYLRQRPTDVERKKASGQLAPGESDSDRSTVENDIFAARIEIPPDPIPASEIADRQINRLFEWQGKEKMIRQYLQLKLTQQARTKGGDAPTTEQLERLAADPQMRRRVLADMRKEAIDAIKKGIGLVEPGQLYPIRFSDIHPPAGRPIKLRYRLQAKKTRSVSEPAILKSVWTVHRPTRDGRERRGVLERGDAPETAGSINIPPEMVTDDHRLLVTYRSRRENATDVVLKPEDIRLQYVVGTFAGNVVRAGVIILVRMMFLAAVGVFCGTFISFPVACIACLVILWIGLMGEFTLEATKLPHHTQRDMLAYVSNALARGTFFVLPKLPMAESPGGNLRDGLLIVWDSDGRDDGRKSGLSGPDDDGQAAVWMGLRTALVLALGGLFFWRRELARVQV